MKIRAKFTLVALVASMIPLGGYFAISYNTSKSMIEEQLRDSYKENTGAKLQTLDDWLGANQSALKVMTTIPGVAKNLAERSAENKAELVNSVKAYPWIRAAFITDAAGMQTLRSDQEKLVAVGDRPYFKEALAKGLGRQLIVSRVTGKPSLILASPLSASAGDGGVGAFAIDLEQITKSIVNDPKADPSERRFLFTADGKVLARSDGAPTAAKDGELTTANSIALWGQKQEGGEFSLVRYTDAEGKSWLGSIRQSKQGWYVGIETPEEVATAPLDEMKKRAFFAFGLAAAFAAFVSFVAGGLLSRPIRDLTDATKKIAEGDFDDQRLDSIKSKDEIGTLSRSIKRLSSSVKIAMQNLAN